MYYVLLNESNRIEHILDMVNNPPMMWNIAPEEGRHIVVQDSIDEIDSDNNWYDYVYNEETKQFDYDPEEEVIEYTDISTGETKSMTSSDIDALVDEKVRNNVEAIMQQMIDEGKFTLDVASTVDEAVARASN